MRRTVLILGVTGAVAGCARAPEPASLDPVPPPLPERVELAVAEASYAVSSHRVIRQQSAPTNITLRYRLRIQPSGNGTVTFAIDTIISAAAPNITAEDIASAQRTTFDATVSENGATDNIRDRGPSSAVRQYLRAAIARLFPRLPDGGVEIGDTWTDSVAATTGADDTQVTTEGTVVYRAQPWTDFLGREGMPLLFERRYDVRGSGTQMGQEFTITGSGVATGTSFLAADGTFLGSMERDSMSGEIVLTGLGITIPITQTHSDTVRLNP